MRIHSNESESAVRRVLHSLLVSTLAGVLLASPVFADPSHQPLGSEFPVGDVFPPYQGVSGHHNAIAFDAVGNSVVVFGSTHHDISGDPYFQRFDAAGDPIGSPVLVNPTINQLEYAPSLAMGADGDFVVVWQASGPDGDNFGIFARVFHADGSPVGTEFQVNQVIAGGQGRPTVGMDASGNIAICWGTPVPNNVVSLRTFYPDGSPRSNEIVVASGASTGASMGMLATGQILVAWGSNTPSLEIMGQCFDLDGIATGAAFMVNDSAVGNQMQPFVAAGANGQFAVLFWQVRSSVWTTQARRFDGSGTPLAPQFEAAPSVPAEPVPARAALTASGELVTVWHRTYSGTTYDILARVIGADDTPLTPVFQVNTTTSAGGQRYPSVAISDDDSFSYSVVWTSAVAGGSAGSVLGQRFGCPNQPPVADAGFDIAAACTSSAGADVTLDGTGSSDPDGDPLEYQWHVAEDPLGVPFAVLDDPTSPTPTGTFPLGETLVTLVVTDPTGEIAVDDVLVTVSDTTDPTALCTTDFAALWPPNHRMVPVTVSVIPSDDCTAPEFLLVQCHVSSSEPDDANGDGEFTGDVGGEDGYAFPVELSLSYNPDTLSYDGTIELRAERDGGSGGRVYSIVSEVTDLSGNTEFATCAVAVPHDRRKK